ncbi:hypothetical protein Rhein_2112 [Rheinheimera sp. A13L]|uniref:hypothetical protein n=1 Tax=Rheinheimera sp. A13L TaxID=506534 RepID=UPI0002125604|nr:hypothetical protein [Rheinheimera sp. A13L]EGM77852.1 hypothetical protein Rhein_2112 [Rheinheimera sp. A13L]
MDFLVIDAVAVQPEYFRMYEELIDIGLSEAVSDLVFVKKPNTLSYAFEQNGISLGYYKILSTKAAATQGVTIFTLHKQ